MNTVAIKAQQAVDNNSNLIQDKIFSLIKASWKQIKKLAWLFEHTASYSERLLRERDLGPEYRRMKW
jgi:hypothetical protein